ncbi:MAG: MgtC/SapB family protein, partial [Gammaproteobacteria bacterium]
MHTELLWPMGLTLAVCALIGLEFHRYQREEDESLAFGTVRTLPMIGLTGFVLFKLDPGGLLFAFGLLLLGLWLGIYYRQRVHAGAYSLIGPIIGILAYLPGALVLTTPAWFVVLYAVIILLFLAGKPRIHAFADTLTAAEIGTLVKFVIMAGIVLPLLPDRQIATFIPATFRAAWLAVVVISGISYIGYLAQAYLARSRGLLLAALLGGIYSSTATTAVLARRAHQQPQTWLISPAIVLATGMMYLRLLAIAFVVTPSSSVLLAIPMLLGALAAIVIAWIMYRVGHGQTVNQTISLPQHPLEFTFALFYAGLFILFVTATQFVMVHFHQLGVELLAFLVGFVDVDPFELSILTGQISIPLHLAVDAIVIAAISNNILKAAYALLIARNRSVLPAVFALLGLSMLSLFWLAI